MNKFTTIIRILEVLFVIGCFYTATSMGGTNVYLILLPAILLLALHVITIIYRKSCNAADIATLTLLILSTAGNVLLMANRCTTEDYPTWQLQLEYAAEVSKEKRIKLVNYREKGIIKDEKEKEAVITQMFAPDSPFCFSDTILRMKTALQEPYFAEVAHSMRHNVEKVVRINMKTMLLEWNCNGNIYHSTALIDENTDAIVYDNVGSYATGAIFNYDEEMYYD